MSMHKVQQNLNVVLVRHKECLLHHAVSQLAVGVLLHLVFVKNDVIEVVLDEDSRHLHFCIV